VQRALEIAKTFAGLERASGEEVRATGDVDAQDETQAPADAVLDSHELDALGAEQSREAALVEKLVALGNQRIRGEGNSRGHSPTSLRSSVASLPSTAQATVSCAPERSTSIRRVRRPPGPSATAAQRRAGGSARRGSPALRRSHLRQRR
jgi:hypothetical protein